MQIFDQNLIFIAKPQTVYYVKTLKSFWKCINKQNNSASTKHAAVVGGYSGTQNIAEMWRKHFEQLYNSVHDNKSKDLFYEHLANYGLTNKPFIITVKDLVECIRKQKQGKAIGPDGIAMESIIHADNRLLVYLGIMFNLFLKEQTNKLIIGVPPAFIQSTIIPLVKLKNGDLTDVNNYRAIAISTSLSKWFKSVLVGMHPLFRHPLFRHPLFQHK